MLAAVFLFLLGLAFLIGGGEALVRGAATIARAAGVPPVVVGLTIVAFGTSSPEFVVAVTGALTGAEGVSFGNVVGANILNITLILGLTASLMPLSVSTSVVVREIPMASLAMLAALILAIDALLGSGPDRLDRGDGLILLLLFGVFLYYTIGTLLDSRSDSLARASRELGGSIRFRILMAPVALALSGLVSLAIGGSLLVDNAVTIAAALGMTHAAIGLTIVSIGTTMPELTVVLLAVWKRESDLAVGNIIGSNIFNVLAVLGTAAVITPIDVTVHAQIALVIATGLTLLLIVLSATHKRTIIRHEGLLLLAAFLAYMAWMFSSQ